MAGQRPHRRNLGAGVATCSVATDELPGAHCRVRGGRPASTPARGGRRIAGPQVPAAAEAAPGPEHAPPPRSTSLYGGSRGPCYRRRGSSLLSLVAGRGLAARPGGSHHSSRTLLPRIQLRTTYRVVQLGRGHAARLLLLRPSLGASRAACGFFKKRRPEKPATVKVWWTGRAESGLSSLDADLIC